MKHKDLIRMAVLGMAAIMTFSPVNASASELLKVGCSGTEVKTVQTTLKELGYFTYQKTTGYYGSITEKAVKKFQRDNGLLADGIIGSRTFDVLFTDTDSMDTPKITLMKADASSKTAVTSAKTGALDWFLEVQYIFSRGTDAVVTDIDTGKSFQVRRTYGTNHADVEPLSEEDSNIIKDIWGGWSWERRAVVVQVGDCILAGSMTGMPHAGVDSAPAEQYVSGRSNGYGYGQNLDKIKNNGARGVLDIHFKNSRTHTTNVVLKSQQDMVKKAANYIRQMEIKTVDD